MCLAKLKNEEEGQDRLQKGLWLRFGKKKKKVRSRLHLVHRISQHVWDSQNFILQLCVVESKLHHVHIKLYFVHFAQKLF